MATIFDALISLTNDGEAWALNMPNVHGQGRSRHIATRDSERLERFCKKNDKPGYATYFAVSTIQFDRPRQKEFAVQTPWLWSDIDWKDTDVAPEEILERLWTLPCSPTRVHATGGGYHVFWFLDTPAGRDQFQRIERLLKRLAEIVCGDRTVTHVAALLRVPGTTNTKRAEPVRVTVVRETTARYSLDELEQWLDGCAQPLIVARGIDSDTNLFSRFASDQTFKAPIDVDQRLKDMRHKGPLQAAIHPTQLQCTAALLVRGVNIDDVVELVLKATQEAPGTENWNWSEEKRKIHRLCIDWIKDHPSPAISGPRLADATGARDAGVNLDDFQAYMPMHNYIYTPTREPWPASSVDARLPTVPLFAPDGTPVTDEKGKQKKESPSRWLDKNHAVEQMTWAPGEPMLIRDRLISDGGFVKRKGVTVLNLYRPATIELGDGSLAQPWLDHVRKVYPENADHIVEWLAQRVQSPGEKINHALVLGGDQGIGKDTLLDAAKQAVGPWNFIEVSPKQTLGRFNGFLKSTILRISEARDTGGEGDRFQFYEHTKVYTAAPPDVLRVDEKNLREYNILNCCGVVITTNRKDSLYLPPDDRRHYVAWSNLSKEDFDADYWERIWTWYEGGGYRHVAAYLSQLDLSEFNPKAPPPKTDVFWQVVEVNRTTESSEFAHVLDSMENPVAVTLPQLAEAASASEVGSSSAFDGDFYAWLVDRKNRRQIPHRMEDCGYVPVRNQTRKDGLWKVGGKAQVVYARKELSFREQYVAATELTRTRPQDAEGGRQ